MGRGGGQPEKKYSGFKETLGGQYLVPSFFQQCEKNEGGGGGGGLAG